MSIPTKPDEPPVFEIEYRSGSDKDGVCSFTLTWRADYHPGDPRGEHRRAKRAQCFRADPRKYGFVTPEKAGYRR